MRRDRVALFLVDRRAAASPSRCWPDLQQRRHPRPSRQRRRRRPHADLDDLCAGGRRRRPASAWRERSDDLTGAMHAIRSGDAIAAVYIPQNFERDLIGAQASADRRLLQPAVSSRPATTPRARSPARSPRRRRRCRRPRPAQAPASAGLAGRRAICADQSGAELCAVPAARDPADRAARRDRDRRPAMRSARNSRARSMGAWLRAAGGSPLDGARRQARAAFRHLRPDDGRRRRDHPRRSSTFRSAAIPC